MLQQPITPYAALSFPEHAIISMQMKQELSNSYDLMMSGVTDNAVL